MAALGFDPADIAPPVFDVVPDNWPAAQLFCELSGQWRCGPGGPIALDYGVLFARLDRMRLTDDEHERIYADVRVMEAEALAAIHADD